MTRAVVILAAVLAAMTAPTSGRRVVDVAISGASASANPIRRVVTLLQQMAKKVEAEGAREEELYDKFMCYCQSGGGQLAKSISESTAKVPALQSSIEEAEQQKVQLEADVKQHQADRAAAKAAMEEATALRKKAAADFAKEKAVYDANIDALTKATAAIEKGMAGGFLQTGSAAVLRRLVVSADCLSEYDRDTVSAFLSQGSGAADDEGYAPKGGEIVGILKQMLDSMAKGLAEITADEEKAIADFKELIAAKTKEVAANTKAIESKLTRIGELGVEIVNMKADLTDTEAALIEDQKFLADLEKTCATKKAEYEERVKTRSQELAAIHDTIKILNDDDALELFKKTLPSASLVQVTAHAADMRRRALAIVRRAWHAAKGPGRVGLGLLGMALGGKGVSFEKVIKMIDNMVALLKEEQLEDDSKKEYCEKQLDFAEDKTKELQRAVSDLATAIEDKTTSVAALTEEMKTLEEGIVALDKAVVEATEQRKDENKEYTELMASDAAAKELIGFAKNRLNKFYNPKLYKAPPKKELSEEERIATNLGGAAFVQLGSSRRAVRGAEDPGPAPETWGAYSKKGEESSGVIAMLDMLVGDLDKEMTEATAQEKNAQAEYEQTMSDSAAKRAEDTKSIATKADAKAGLESDIVAAKEEQTSKTKELMATEKYASGLHAECDWLLSNFQLRKEARAGEIEALQQAKAVLSGADFSLVQTAMLRGR